MSSSRSYWVLLTRRCRASLIVFCKSKNPGKSFDFTKLPSLAVRLNYVLTNNKLDGSDTTKRRPLIRKALCRPVTLVYFLTICASRCRENRHGKLTTQWASTGLRRTNQARKGYQVDHSSGPLHILANQLRIRVIST